GLSPGSGSEAFMAGFAGDEVRPRYQSAVQIFEQARTGRPVTVHDPFYDFDDLEIVPRWEPTGDAPGWVAVTSTASAAWTAQRGWKLVTGALSTNTVNQIAARYREAAEASGQSTSPSMLGLRRRVFVAESDSEAQEKVAAAADIMPYML